jgi:energy-coupling factor transporter ATP-binding protein EcfA2
MLWTQRDRERLTVSGDAQRARQRRTDRRRAKKRVKATPESIRGRAVLGPAIVGDLPRGWLARRPFGGSFVVLDESNLGRHVVVVGQPGSGKTVTLLQLAYLASKLYGWRVFFLDGKGDHATQREFVATMLHAGLDESEMCLFPQESFDGWRTTGMLQDGFTQLLNRLLGVIDFSEPYYEDATRAFVSQALMLEGSLPESSDEFLERLECLIKASAVEQRREAMGTLLRYRAFFESFPGKLDGSWSFEDKRAAYVLLEGLAQPKEAGRLAAYLFESFKHFAVHAKQPGDRVLLIVDEFPAVQEDADAAGLIERLRSFGCSVGLSAQSYEGLGAARDRIITAARSLIVHSCPGAEEIVRLAGTQQGYAVTSQVDYRVGATGLGSVRPEQRFRVDPNLLGSLHEGEAFVIAQRRAHLVRVARRPMPDPLLLRASEVTLPPKMQVERLSDQPPMPPPAAEVGPAIDW